MRGSRESSRKSSVSLDVGRSSSSSSSLYDAAMEMEKEYRNKASSSFIDDIGTSVEYLDKTFGQGLAAIDRRIEMGEMTAFGPPRSHAKIMEKVNEMRELQAAIFRNQFQLEVDFEKNMREEAKQFVKKEPEKFCQTFQQRFDESQPRANEIGNQLERLQVLIGELNSETLKTSRRQSTTTTTAAAAAAATSSSAAGQS